MFFFTLDRVYAVEAPSIGKCRFTRQARGPWVIPRRFFVGWSLFSFPSELLTTSLVRPEEKNTDVGLRTEWPYRGTCHTFPFWIIPHCVSAKKTARGECVWRGSLKACPQYWHIVSGVWEWACVRVCVRDRERPRETKRDQEGECVGVGAHTSICTVCLYRRVNDCVCVCGTDSVNMQCPTRVWARGCCMPVSVYTVCVCEHVCVQVCVGVCFCICPYHFAHNPVTVLLYLW